MRGFATVGLALLALGFSTEMSAQQPSAPNVSVTLANEPWILVLNLKDFAVKTNGPQPDGRVYLLAENQKTNVTLSVYLEKVKGQATAADCAENQKQRLEGKVAYKREKIETRESAGMAILEYTIPEVQGMPIQQRNLFACVPKDDVYVDVHLSKVLFKPQDEGLFAAVLNSISYIPKTTAGNKKFSPIPYGPQ
jgi:hypothetical protein